MVGLVYLGLHILVVAVSGHLVQYVVKPQHVCIWGKVPPVIPAISTLYEFICYFLINKVF